MNALYVLVLILHVLVCLFLIGVILLQGGRGGLSEAMGGAAAQSLFGGGVTTVLTRITGVCAALFVATCLSLAYLSTMRGRSVIEQMPRLPEGVGLPPLTVPEPPVVAPSAAQTVPATPASEAPPAPATPPANASSVSGAMTTPAAPASPSAAEPATFVEPAPAQPATPAESTPAQ